MTTGTLFYIVGPSGAGKDTLIAGALARLAGTGRWVGAQRWITRSDAIGEEHAAVDRATFEALRAEGRVLHSWEAHGLGYALPTTILDDLAGGRSVLANGSRAAIPELGGRVSRFVVIEVTAPVEVLRARILARGRENGEAVEHRLARAVEPLAVAGDFARIVNDGAVDDAVEAFVAVLERFAARPTIRALPFSDAWSPLIVLPRRGVFVDAESLRRSGRAEISTGKRTLAVSVLIDEGDTVAVDEVGLSREAFQRLGVPEGTPVSIGMTPSPTSARLLRRKIAGERLGEDDYGALFDDVVAGRYRESEIAAFLLKTIQSLDEEEVVTVARARRRFMNRIDWGVPIVVDKHSLGGVPGNRLTPIVVPIVAAYGLLMPKTSSRAITSASGTADTMEVAARIDLDAAEVRSVVEKVGGCVVWNGRLNHSPLDDVVNAFTRSLGLDGNRWSVASILSKKWSAGATHVVIDIPYGPSAKVPDRAAAVELGHVFETVGAGLGLEVVPIATRADGAVGRGIGPALELRDALLVLDDSPDAPADLREKVLLFASTILSFSPQVGTIAAGRRIAETLLASGAARARFDAMVAAQGPHPIPAPAPFTHVVRAPFAGRVAAFDGWRLAGIARRAGAPFDKVAGLDLAVGLADPVAAGTALFTIHASSATELQGAVDLAAEDDGIEIVPSTIGTADDEPTRDGGA